MHALTIQGSADPRLGSPVVLQGACGTPAAAVPTFFLAAIRNPQRIGAISASSPRIAVLLASVVPTVGEPVVVELGPGTGAVSSAIAARLPRGARHVAVELDAGMAAFLRQRHTGVDVVNADACHLSELLAARSIPRVPAVVSGLPWSLFDSSTQDCILQQIAEAIGQQGVFTTFAYTHARMLPSARNFRRALQRTFAEVQVSRLVWQNMPPAFSYICKQPRLL